MAKYPKLRNFTLPNSPEACTDSNFEAVAGLYIKLFDEVIGTIEETPADVSSACQRLQQVGKLHRTRVAGMKAGDFQQLEAPFLYMVGEALQDRYNDKAETLFRKFFQFTVKYLQEGFNQ